MSLWPIREILVLSCASGIVLTVLLSAVSALKVHSNAKSEAGIEAVPCTVKSLDYDLDRNVYVVYSWPHDLCEIHADSGSLNSLPTPQSPLQISHIASSRRNSTTIELTESTDSGRFPKQIYVSRQGDLILSEEVPEDIASVTNASLSDDGSIGVITGEDGAVVCFDLASDEHRQWRFDAGHSIFADRLSPDGQRLFLADSEGSSFVYDVHSGKKISEIQVDAGCSRVCAWSCDSKSLAVSDFAGSIHVFNGSDGSHLRTHKIEFLVSRSLAFSDDGHFLAVGCNEKRIYLWDLSTMSDDPVLVIHTASIAQRICFVGSGKTIVCGNDDGSIVEWSTETGRMIRKLR